MFWRPGIITIIYHRKKVQAHIRIKKKRLPEKKKREPMTGSVMGRWCCGLGSSQVLRLRSLMITARRVTSITEAARNSELAANEETTLGLYSITGRSFPGLLPLR